MFQLEEMVFWHWWVLAILFFAIEVFAPGAVFLWIGVASVAVGVLLWAVPEVTWQNQLLVFSVISVASIVAWRFYSHRNPPAESDQPALNRRGAQYVGRTFTLEAPIVNGLGVLRIDDTRWKIEGEEMPEGTRVKVIGVEGTILRVVKNSDG